MTDPELTAEEVERRRTAFLQSLSDRAKEIAEGSAAVEQALEATASAIRTVDETELHEG